MSLNCHHPSLAVSELMAQQRMRQGNPGPGPVERMWKRFRGLGAWGKGDLKWFRGICGGQLGLKQEWPDHKLKPLRASAAISLSSRKGPVLSFPIQGTAQSSLSTVDAIRSQWTKHQYLDASSALTKLWKTTLFSMYKEQEDERYSSQRNLLGKINPGLTPMLHSTIGLTAGSVDHSPSSSMKGVPWWTSPLQGKDFLQVCKYFQQSHVMPLLKLMTSNNLKMDWCNYGHNVTFHFDFNLV